MLRASAAEFAAKIAASYPSSRIGRDTLAEWTDELEKLQHDRANAVVNWLRDNLDSAPTFKQIRLAMARTRPTAAADPGYSTPGLNDPCEFCQQPVPNGPDAGTRYDAEFDRFFNCHMSCAGARSLSPSQTGEK